VQGRHGIVILFPVILFYLGPGPPRLDMQIEIDFFLRLFEIIDEAPLVGSVTFGRLSF